MTTRLYRDDDYGDPPSLVGTAGYTPDGRLRIGEGDAVVEIPMGPSRFAAKEARSRTGIGVYVLGWLHSYAEVLLSHEQQPSALELRAYRAQAYRTREEDLTPPTPPGEYVGRAGCGDGSVLRIGSGDRVVHVDLGERVLRLDQEKGIATPGASNARSIGVYIRRGGHLGFDEIVLSHFRQLTFSEWWEHRRQRDRFLEERLRRLGESAPSNTTADHPGASADPDAPGR